MRGNIKLGTLFNIPISIHWTFLLFIPLVFKYGADANAGTKGYIVMGLVALAIFISAFVHTLAHALAGKRDGVAIEGITLLPLSGITAYGDYERLSKIGFRIAIAGPAASFTLLTVSMLLLLGITDISQPFALEALFSSYFEMPIFHAVLLALVWVNGFIFTINLVPVFPLDGARILRTLLHLSIGKNKALSITKYISQAIAIGIALLGILGSAGINFYLVFISVYIFFVSRQEYHSVKLMDLLQHTAAETVLNAQALTFFKEDPMPFIISQHNRYPGLGYAVHDETEQYLGMLYPEDINKAQAGVDKEISEKVLDYFHNDIEPVFVNTNLSKIFTRFRKEGQQVFPVVDELGKVLGMIEFNAIMEFIHRNLKRK